MPYSEKQRRWAYTASGKKALGDSAKDFQHGPLHKAKGAAVGTKSKKRKPRPPMPPPPMMGQSPLLSPLPPQAPPPMMGGGMPPGMPPRMPGMARGGRVKKSKTKPKGTF
jgi:hypothetical protein